MRDEKWITEFQSFTESSALPESDGALLQVAKSVLNQSYAPYSNFQVAAAVRLKGGKVVTGTNQENAAYGLSLCAEQNVLATVGSQDYDKAIEALAITIKYLNRVIDYPITPCGACRQVIREHELRHDHPIRIILQGETGKILIFKSISALLPMAFTPDDLLK